MADWPYDTSAWKRLRRAKLASSPLCEPCGKRGVVKQAKHVDHITAIAKGGEAFPPLDGLMSLCPSCHSIKTRAVDQCGGSGIRFKGCGIDGLPLDPDHPFFKPDDQTRPEGYTPQGTGVFSSPTADESFCAVSFAKKSRKSFEKKD